MPYDEEVKRAAYFYCNLLPRDIEYMDPRDLDIVLSAGIEKRKIDKIEQDARFARMTSDIINNVAGLFLGIKEPVTGPLQFMPENRGKVAEDPGMDGNQFAAWAKAYNEKVEANKDADDKGDA